MVYLTMLVVVTLFFGLAVVVSSPSPYFGAFGLVLVAGLGCVLLAEGGMTFLSLILFLIYLGGMMVVFVYTAALGADLFPEAFGLYKNIGGVLVYSATVFFMLGVFYWGGFGGFLVISGNYEFNNLAESCGVGEMYGVGGGMLLVGGWVLFLTLFVVLVVVRGLSRGALRGV